MSTTYTDTKTIYTFQANGPVFFGAFSVVVDRQVGFSYTEADVDTAVEAFTNSLNTSGHEHVDQVAKVIEAAGTSDWTYEPA